MTKQTITVIPGDGIGPSIIDATIKVLDKAGCNFDYEFADAGLTALEKHGELVPEETIKLIEKNKVTLKGPLTTPVGEGFTSINVTLRKQLPLRLGEGVQQSTSVGSAGPGWWINLDYAGLGCGLQ